MSSYTIIGAGVAGLTVATALHAQGADVAIYDPNGAPGEHCCSWWAGGMLAPWCEFENAEEPILRHGKRALEWWKTHTTVETNGTLVLAKGRDLPDLKRFSRRTEGFTEIDQSRIQELEPDLGDYSHGLFFQDEAHLDPRAALKTLSDNLLGNGIEITSEKAPSDVKNPIYCTGFHAKSELDNLRGVKGEMIIVKCPDITISRPIRLLHPRIPIYIVPRSDQTYMIGATMIESEDRTRFTARSMLELLSAAYALHPAFGEAEILETGVDLRPALPDNVPRGIKTAGGLHINGLYRHGFLMAPALAEAATKYLLHGTSSELIHAD